MANNDIDIELLAGLSEDTFGQIVKDIKEIQKRLEASGIKLNIDIDAEQIVKKIVSKDSIGSMKKAGMSLSKALIEQFGVVDKTAKEKIKNLSSELKNIRVGEIKTGTGNDALTDTMRELSDVVLNNANIIQQRLGIYDEFYNYLKKISTIKISDAIKGDLGDDWNSLRQLYPSKFSTTKGIELDSIYQELSTKFKDIFSGTSNPADQFRELTTAIQNYRADVNKIEPLDASTLGLEDDVFQTMITELSKLDAVIKKSDLTDSVKGIKEEAQSMDSVTTAAKDASTAKEKFVDANREAAQTAEITADAVNQERAAMMNMNDIDSILAGINMQGRQGTSVFNSLGDSFRAAFSAYAYTAANLMQDALYGIVDAGKEAVETVKELDDAAVSLQMATGADKETVKAMLSDYNALGMEIGALTTEISDSADAWLRQGHSVEDTNTLIYDSMVLSKIANIEAAESAEYLTSAMKGYKTAVEDVIGIVDRVSQVDLSAAVDAGGLMQAMSRTAVTADSVGVSMDKLLGYLAVVGETTHKNMSSVGESFKTIFSRMSDIKANKLELIDEDGTTELLSDVELTLSKVGIDLRSTVTEFDNYGEVLDNLAAKWDTLNPVQQAALTKAFSGTRQSENFKVLMENYDTALKYEQISMDSSGKSVEKFDNYLNSLEAKTKSLQASLDNLASVTISDALYGSILEIAKSLVDAAADTGILKNALIGLGTAGSIYGIQHLVSFAHDAAQEFANLSEAMNISRAGNIGESELQRLIDLTGGLTQSQTRLLLSTDNLSDAQKVAILMNQGMSQAEAQAQIQTWGLVSAQSGATGATITFKSALQGLWATMLANPMVLVTVGVTAAVSAFNSYKQNVEEAKQATKEAASEASTLTSELSDLTNKYFELSEAVKTDESAKESLISTQQELLEKLGLEGESIDGLIEKYGSLSEAIKQVTIDFLKEAQIDLIAGLDTARNELLDVGKDNFIGTSNSLSATGDDAVKAYQALEKAGIIGRGSYGSGGGSLVLTGDDSTVEGILENYRKLDDALKALRDSDQFTAEELSNNPVYQKIYNRWNEMKESVEGYESAIDNLNSNLAQQTMLSSLQGMELPDTKEEFEQFRQELVATAIASKQFIGTEEEIEAAINSYLSSVPEFAGYYSSPLKEELDEVQEVLTKAFDVEGFNDTIKSFEDGYSKLTAAQEEWNEVGSLSASTFVDLQENGLLEYLEITSEGLIINRDKLLESAEAAKSKAVSDLHAAMMSDMLAVAIGDTSTMSEAGQAVIAQLGQNAETAGKQAMESVAGWATLGQTISNVMESAGVTGISTNQQQQMSAIYDYYKNLANSVSAIDITTASDSGSTTDYKSILDKEITAQEKAYEAGKTTFKEYLDNRKQLVEKYYRDKKITTAEYYEELEDLAQAEADFYDEVLAAVTRRIQREIDGIQDIIDGIQKQIDQLEKQKDIYDSVISAVIRRYDKETDGINDVIEALEKQNEELEKQQDNYDGALSAIVAFLESQKDAIQNNIDSIGKENDAIQDQIDKYDLLLNAVTLVFDEKREAIQTEQDAIQERIDALQAENDEHQKALELEKAKDELYKARNQRIKYIYNGTQFVYQTDYDSIADAEQTLSDLSFDATIDALEKEKELLQDIVDQLDKTEESWQKIATNFDDNKAKSTAQELFGDDYENIILNGDPEMIASIMNQYTDAQQKLEDNDNTISSLEDQMAQFDAMIEKWESVASAKEDATNREHAAALFGQQWEQIILANRETDFEDFKNKYLSIQDQIEDNQTLIDSYNEKITYYENLKAEWESLSSLYQEKLEDKMAADVLGADWEDQIQAGRLEAFDSFKNEYLSIQAQIDDNQSLIDSYNEKITYYEGLKSQWESITDKIQEEADEQLIAEGLGASGEADILSGRMETLNNFRAKYEEVQQALADAAWASANEQIKAAQEAEQAQKIIEDTGVKTIQNETILTKNRSSNDKFYLETISKYHGGLDEGYVGSNYRPISSEERLDILRKASIGGLKDDEVPAILKKDELVLTPEQINGITNTLIERDYGNLFNDWTPPVTKNERSVNIQFGDIHLHGVQDPDSFAKQIVARVPNMVTQMMYKQ